MRQLPTVKPKPPQRFAITNFYGGLNTRDAQSDIGDNESQDLLNIEFSESGSFSKRLGTNLVGDDKGNTKVLGLFSSYYGNGSAQMLMASQDASTAGLYYRTTGNWTEVTKDAGATKLANADAEFQNFLGDTGIQYSFVIDGTKYQKYKPSDNTLYAATASPATIGSIIRTYKNRMYAVGSSSKPERVYFSALGNGDSWGVNDYFDVPSQAVTQTGATGDPITALASFQDRLFIFKARSTWVWDTYKLIQLSNSQGCVGKRAFVATDNYLYFADNDGVYKISGTYIEKISKKIQPTWDVIPAARIPEIALTYFQGKLYVATAATGASNNNIILVNYTQLPQDAERQQPWTYWSGTANNPLAAACFTVYEASTTTAPILAYGCANANTAVLQLGTGTADYEFTVTPAQDEAINAYYQTKDFFVPARYQKVFISHKAQATSYNLTITTTIDFSTTVTNTMDMQSGSYDALIQSKNISRNGKYISHKVSNANASQPFTIYQIMQTYKPSRLR